VASHPGGSKGCGASCTNLALTPENLRHASEEGDLALATPEKGGREEQCNNCNELMTSDHQCNENEDNIVDIQLLLQDISTTPSRCLQPGAAPPSRVRHPTAGIGTSPTAEVKDGKTYFVYTFESGQFKTFVVS
jgi:hypothetical protein